MTIFLADVKIAHDMLVKSRNVDDILGDDRDRHVMDLLLMWMIKGVYQHKNNIKRTRVTGSGILNMCV